MRPAGALLLALIPAHLPAQVSFTFSAGARRSTVLVHDQIVNTFDVRPALAPAFAVAASIPLDNPWQASAMLDVSTSEVQREDATGGSQGITHLTQVALAVGLSRSLKPWLDGAFRVGVLKYLPSEDLGLFQSGGPFFPYAQVAFGVRPPVIDRFGLGLEVRADLHRFITDALRVEGFSDARPVARFALAVTWAPRRVRAGVGAP